MAGVGSFAFEELIGFFGLDRFLYESFGVLELVLLDYCVKAEYLVLEYVIC